MENNLARDRTLITGQKIHKISREIKKQELGLYSCLKSIDEDMKFVQEVSNWYRGAPVLANLRCGLWYAPMPESTCYFKSTDGHNNNWSFSLTRLNLHVAKIAASNSGCLIVDATRKGKLFPDAMNKTIPIWAAVLNRAVHHVRQGNGKQDNSLLLTGWDNALHLPLWVSSVERSSIESRMCTWVHELLRIAGSELDELSRILKKPLRPLWVSQNSVVWVNEIPAIEEFDFYPLILVSASQPRNCPVRESDWVYVPGAGDDEESWSAGLRPAEFHASRWQLLDAGPCRIQNVVCEIVNKRRTLDKSKVDQPCNEGKGLHHAQRRVDAHHPTPLGCKAFPADIRAEESRHVTFIGDTGLAIGTGTILSRSEALAGVQSVVNLCIDAVGTSALESHSFPVLHSPVKNFKMDKHSLEHALEEVLPFARKQLLNKQTVLIVCDSGVDSSVCAILAVLIQVAINKTALWKAVDGSITKETVRKCLAYVCSFYPYACPSRSGLRQVYNFCSNNSR